MSAHYLTTEEATLFSVGRIEGGPGHSTPLLHKPLLTPAVTKWYLVSGTYEQVAAWARDEFGKSYVLRGVTPAIAKWLSGERITL